MSTFHNTNFTLNYLINILLLIVILKISFVLNHYFKLFFCTYLIFLILHLKTILKINYIFVIHLILNFLKIKKCEHTNDVTPYLINNVNKGSVTLE